MLTIRQMRYFEVLADLRHFGQAARRLNISQPALSAQIAQMETALGAPLFERRPAGVLLTRDGAAAIGRVRRILADIRDLERMGLGGEVLSGRLRLGLIATAAPYLLPALLPALARHHPRLECEVRESLTDTLLRDLASGDLDCAVLARPVAAPDLETLLLCEDVFHLAVPAARGAGYGSAVSAAALAGERLILLEEGHCLRDQALGLCKRSEARALAGVGATSLATILRMVAGGLGATLIPGIAVAAESRDGGIRVVPFEAPAPSRTLVLAFRATTTRRPDFEALAVRLRQAVPPGDAAMGEQSLPRP